MIFKIPDHSRSIVSALLLLVSAGIVAFGCFAADFFPATLSQWTNFELKSTGVYLAATAAIFALSVGVTGSLVVFSVAVFGWTAFLFGILPLLSVGYLALVAVTIGHRLLLLTGSVDADGRGLGLRAALGYGVLVGVFQLTAFFPINTASFVVLVTLPLLLLLRDSASAILREFCSLLTQPRKLNADTVSLLLPTSILLVLLVYASYPESHSDALVTHLMIPHQVSVHGEWSFDVSKFFFAVMPKGTVWLFSAHYLMGGELAARLFNFLVTAGSAWIIYATVQQIAGRTAGSLLAALFLSAPLTAWVVFVMFEDSLLAYLSLAAAVMLAKNWSRPSSQVAFLVTLLLSAAVATKIQGLFTAVPTAALLLARIGWVQSVSMRQLCVCLAPLLLIGAVPYLTAAVITGNPVFPMFNEIFRSPFYPAVNFSDNRWSGKFSIGILYDITFQTKRFMEGYDGAFGLGHLLVLPAAVMATLFAKRSFALILLTILVVASALLMPLTQYARYFYFTFSIVAILSATLFAESSAAIRRYILIPIVLLAVCFNLALTRSLNAYYRFILPFPIFGETMNQPAPVAERYLNGVINRTIGPSARVLYIPRPYGAGLDGLPLYGNFLNPRLEAELRGVKTPDEARALILSWGITNVITLAVPTADYPPFIEALPKLGTVTETVGDTLLWTISVDPQSVAAEKLS